MDEIINCLIEEANRCRWLALAAYKRIKELEKQIKQEAAP